MIGVGIAVASGCGILWLAWMLVGEIAAAGLLILAALYFLGRGIWWLFEMLVLMRRCDDRDPFVDPDPKPRRRAF